MSISLFKEDQKFKRIWIWVSITLSVFGLLVMGINIFKEGLENTDNETLIASVVIFIIMCGMIMMFTSMKLEVNIDKYSIKYRFVPFIWSWRKINKEQIESIEVSKMSALHYGGLGYRKTWRYRAFIMGGKQAAKIKLKNKRVRLVFSTRKPEEMKAAIEKLMHKEYTDY